jgi:hypothetical protein
LILFVVYYYLLLSPQSGHAYTNADNIVARSFGYFGNPCEAHSTIWSKAREELAQIQREFARLQKRIETVRDSVADSLVRLFGEQPPAFTGLKDEELIERIASKRGFPASRSERSLRHKRRSGTSGRHISASQNSIDRRFSLDFAGAIEVHLFAHPWRNALEQEGIGLRLRWLVTVSWQTL